MSVCVIDHLTVYHYNEVIILQPHTFRLRPRTNCAQRVLDFDVCIEPAPAGSTECLDQDGNLSLHAWFDTPTVKLSIRSTFRVELLRDNAFDFVLSENALHLPVNYPEPLRTALSPYRADGYIQESVRAFARAIAGDPPCNSLLFLILLNQQIFQSFQHITRPEGDAWFSSETLRMATGSCRDLAVLFCDACRAMGFAARFVSGYEYASATAQDPYMHAWAEVYLPEAGWRGYDPSRGLAVSSSHIAVAAAFDPQLAAPVEGLFTSHGTGSYLSASLTMSIEPGSV